MQKTLNLLKCADNSIDTKKLDRVGPVDNRPSTDKPKHFVRSKKKEEKNR